MAKTHWLCADPDNPKTQCWAFFHPTGEGRVQYLAITGAASLLDSGMRGAEREEARSIYRKLRDERGWRQVTPAQVAAAGMNEHRLRLIAYD